MAIVKLVLDISTAHLPQKYGDENSEDSLDKLHGLVVDALETGYEMWIPGSPERRQLGYEIPEEVYQIQMFARYLGCDYVRFDRDSDVVDTLPTWEW